MASRCTELLSEFAKSRETRVFDELGVLAKPFLMRRASVEIGRFGLVIDEGEIVQETLLNLFRYARSFRPRVPHAFTTWTSRIVRNVVLRLLKKRRNRCTISLDDVVGFDLVDPKHTDPLRRLVEQEETLELLDRFTLYLRFYFGSYQNLTLLQQRVMHRVAIEGQNYRQVAGALDMRVEAVKMVVFRARRRIAADMARMAG